MRSKEALDERLKQYQGAKLLWRDYGYIVWQYSTGENVEILFIEVSEPRHGYGTRLIKEMCKHIKPYNSVFVVRRAQNEAAGEFYRSLGFKETTISGLYKDEDAVLGVITYEELLRV